MAFWLASPLMDPAMFLITSGTLGWDFAVAKAMAAIAIGAVRRPDKQWRFQGLCCCKILCE